MLADYHVHCMFSDDSWYPPEQVAHDTWRLNLDEICFTDHVDYGVKPDWDQALSAKVFDGQRVVNVDYDAYFPCVEALRDEWAGRLAVKVGLELDVQAHTIPLFDALWERWGERLDFALLSIHRVGDAEFWTGEFQVGRMQETYNRAYYEELYGVVTRIDHWSALAHLDLIKRYTTRRAPRPPGQPRPGGCHARARHQEGQGHRAQYLLGALRPGRLPARARGARALPRPGRHRPDAGVGLPQARAPGRLPAPLPALPGRPRLRGLLHLRPHGAHDAPYVRKSASYT